MAQKTWSLKIGANQQIDMDSRQCVRITNACLDHREPRSTEKTSLILSHGFGSLQGETATTVCTFQQGVVEHSSINIYLEQGERYTIYVKGPGSIHLLGFATARPVSDSRGSPAGGESDLIHFTNEFDGEKNPDIGLCLSTPAPPVKSHAKGHNQSLFSKNDIPAREETRVITERPGGSSSTSARITDKYPSQSPGGVSSSSQSVQDVSPLSSGSHKNVIAEVDIAFQEIRNGKGDVALRHNHFACIHFISRIGGVKSDVYENETSFEFCVGDPCAPAGFSAGVLGMRTGGQRRIRIPPEIGYRGLLGNIPKLKLVYIDCELVSIS